MSFNAMEQYFESLHREQTNEAWRQLASGIEQPETEAVQVQLIPASQSDPQSSNRYDYLQNADRIEKQVEHDAALERGFEKLSQQINARN